MSRKSAYLKLALVLVVLSIVAMMMGADPWGPV